MLQRPESANNQLPQRKAMWGSMFSEVLQLRTLKAWRLVTGACSFLGMQDEGAAVRRFWEEGDFSDEDDLWGEVQDFWSDDEEEPGKRRRAARGALRPPRPSGPAKLRHHIVTHYNTVTQVGMTMSHWTCRSPAGCPPHSG